MAPQPDLSEFHELGKPKRLKCSIVAALEQLGSDGERALLRAALADRSIRHTAVEAWLARRGIKLADSTVARHRAGRCSCDG